MEEEWRDIEGYDGAYQVSSLGNIRSTDRNVYFYNRWNGDMIERIRKGVLMTPGSSPNGYKIIRLSKDGNPKYYSVHRLVLSAFIKNQHNLPQINHIDGNKTNNKVVNLEWITPSDNIKHAIKLGLLTFNKK